MAGTKDIREAVRAELDFDPLVDPAGIRVKNLNGDVALNGTVPSYPQYVEAAAAARRVDGVTSVHNHLMVVLPPGDSRDDAALTTAANNALALNVTVPGGIEAVANDGNIWLTGTVDFGAQTVTLAGHVRTWAEHDAVLDAAWRGLGVSDVRDDLYITG